MVMTKNNPDDWAIVDVWVSPATLILSSTAAAFIPFFSFKRRSGGGGAAGGVENAYVVSVLFAFTCSFSAVFLEMRRPEAARLFRLSSIFCLSSAFLLLLYALLFDA